MKKYILLRLLQMLMGKKKKKYYRHAPDDIFVYDRAGREIFQGRRKPPRLFRYARFAAFALVLFTLILGGLAVWGAVSAVNYAGGILAGAPAAVRAAQGEVGERREAWGRPAVAGLAEGKERLAELASRPLTTEACLNRISGLLAPSTWLTVPLADHWKKVKEACAERG
jgi:hypothetical protein